MSGGLKCAGPTHVAGPTGGGGGEGGRGEDGREGGEGGREMEQVSYSSVEISCNDNNVCSSVIRLIGVTTCSDFPVDPSCWL